MRKLIYVSTLLLLLALPAVAQLPLFPTPAKEQLAKGSFLMGEGIQIQGNGGYADALAQKLKEELKAIDKPAQTATGTIRIELRKELGMADERLHARREPPFLR